MEKFKLPIALSLVGIVLIIGGIFASGLNKSGASFGSKSKEFPKESLVESQKMIFVDVSGAVEKPGVFKVNEGARIEEVIKMAGGFSEKANKEYISKYLNMAQKLSDGGKVYVPAVGEQVPSTVSQVAGVNSSAKVNINTASQSEIEVLPGIGPVTASKVISGRPYKEIGDLINKKVVGKAVFEKIKDSIVLY